ncbi:uncharacterized protein METZ01_LOCUS130648 [marine metagenome]|uniref:Sulfotransferase domain-containing protein n=1 Tax=marine metagenome TaxID=408172 RepID=A0A381YLC3_9ZZZZ
MILKNNSRPILFIHVRKNAGGSINAWCRDNLNVLSLTTADNGYLQKCEILDSGQYIIFAVKRNPYTRFVSGWHYLNYYNNTQIDLDTFLENPLSETAGHPVGHDWRHSYATQTEFLYNGGKLSVDYLLSFENLQEDFNNFKKEINIDGGDLPVKNKQEYNTTLTGNQRNKIYDYFIEDFKNFGYEK